MAPDSTASSRRSWTLPFTAAICRKCAARIERRPRARSSASLVFYVTVSNVPLMSQLRGVALTLDVETATQKVRRWLNDVANARTHGTTNAVPRVRLSAERPHLLPLPPPYPGRPILNAPQRLADWRTVPPLQHPLSIYDALLSGVGSWTCKANDSRVSAKS
jgi:hypothetical protein